MSKATIASLPVCDIAKPGIFTYKYNVKEEYERFLSIIRRDVQNENCCAITLCGEIVFNKYNGETPTQEWTNKWIRDSFLKEIEDLLFLYNAMKDDYTMEIYMFKTESSKLKINYNASTDTFRVEEFFSKEREAMIAKLVSKTYSVEKIQKELGRIRGRDDASLEDLECYIQLKRAMNRYDYALTTEPNVSPVKMTDIFSDFMDQIGDAIRGNDNGKYKNLFIRYKGLTRAICDKCIELQGEWDDGGNDYFMEKSSYFLRLFKEAGLIFID